MKTGQGEAGWIRGQKWESETYNLSCLRWHVIGNPIRTRLSHNIIVTKNLRDGEISKLSIDLHTPNDCASVIFLVSEPMRRIGL
jgi:hypothetical protein